MHVFLHFNSFCLVVLKFILASKLSELEQFENRAANYQLASIKGRNEAKKKPMPNLLVTVHRNTLYLDRRRWTLMQAAKVRIQEQKVVMCISICSIKSRPFQVMLVKIDMV